MEPASQPKEQGHWKVLARVQKYSLVSSVCEKAKSYYSTAKSSNTVVKLGLEKVESNLIKLSTPVVNTLNKYETQLDSLGCKQLDRLETAVATGKKLVETNIIPPVKGTIDVGKRVIDRTVVSPIGYARTVVDTNVVKPAGTVLEYGRQIWHSEWSISAVKASVCTSADLVLDKTELLVEQYLPPVQENEDGKGPADAKSAAEPALRSTAAGTVSRRQRAQLLADKASRRLWARATKKFRTMKRRSRETIEAFAPYTVDLIKYAREIIDMDDQRVRNYAAKTKEIVAHPVQSARAVVASTLDWVSATTTTFVSAKTYTQPNSTVSYSTTFSVQRDESGGVKAKAPWKNANAEKAQTPSKAKAPISSAAPAGKRLVGVDQDVGEEEERETTDK